MCEVQAVRAFAHTSWLCYNYYHVQQRFVVFVFDDRMRHAKAFCTFRRMAQFTTANARDLAIAPVQIVALEEWHSEKDGCTMDVASFPSFKSHRLLRTLVPFGRIHLATPQVKPNG